MQSSIVALFGMLMVLEMAPEMNGWLAAIMRMWLSTDKNRLPIRPHGLAQSKTGRCSSERYGAPSRVMAPQTKVLVSSISSLEKPRAESMSNFALLRSVADSPKVSTQKVSPKVHLLNTNLISKASGKLASIVFNAWSVTPFSRSVWWLMLGASFSVPRPTA